MSNNSNYLGINKNEKKEVCVENDQPTSKNIFYKRGFLEHKKLPVNDTFKQIKDIYGSYFCCKCAFDTKNLKDFKRHIKTKKHIKKPLLPQNNDETIPSKKHICICGREYKYAPGLSNHKHRCKMLKNILKKTGKNGNLKIKKKKSEKWPKS